MIVKELITQLETYDPSIPVVVFLEKGGLPFYVEPDVGFVEHSVVVIFPSDTSAYCPKK